MVPPSKPLRHRSDTFPESMQNMRQTLTNDQSAATAANVLLQATSRSRHNGHLMLLLTLTMGCGADPVGTCTGFGAPTDSGTVEAAAVTEASGLVASGRHPGVLWAHNDSGDTARLHAIDTTGASAGSLTIAGAIPVDWEDIARDGSTLYVGDIGDNDRTRTELAIWRVEEPEALSDAGSSGGSRILLSYPTGAHDAEALFHHRDTLWILTKDADGAGLYAVDPTLAEQEASLVDVITMPEGVPDGETVTGADTDGERIFVRTESSVLVYDLANDVPDALAGTPCILPAPDEADGESIAALDGGYATVGEGERPTLWITEAS